MPATATVYVTHPRYVEHDLPAHPEHAGRIRAVWKRLEEADVLSRLHVREATPITSEQALLVHTPEYIHVLERLHLLEHSARIDPDTYVNPWSHEIAQLAAGGVVDAVNAVMQGEARNGLAVVRPPGHHAVAEVGMGFCLLSNVAIAARHAQRTFGLERVLIIDYDVHHGNGTQDIFYDDPSVLFISSHQSPLYPYTGAATETGTGRGEGYNINVPIPAKTGDAGFRLINEQLFWPAAIRYQPQFILVSVGHDAHWADPLAAVNLSLTGYAYLAAEMIRMADQLCEGRVVFVMEGGYNLDALSYGWANIARVLLGDAPVDPMGLARENEPDIGGLLKDVREIHGL